MDAGEVLRAVRRREGWSQRELAVRSGVALSTVTAVEAGRRQPSLAALVAVVSAAGLELAVDRPAQPVEPDVLAHLRRSTSARLHLALGGDGRPDRPGHPEAWRQLQLLAGVARVHLHGGLALVVWLPTNPPALTVCAQWWAPGSSETVPGRVPLLSVLPACHSHVAAPVRVVLAPHQVLVDPPGELALHADQQAQRSALRSVARLLHEDAPRDVAGRRPRAHRDPDHVAEHAHVFHTKRFGSLPLPDRSDVRSWRLDDSASKAEWLRRQGCPV